MKFFGGTLPGLRAAAAALALSVAGTCLAQTDVTTSRVNGNVSDATGAPLPGVSVEGKNLETGLTATAVTSSSGGYRLLNLPIGRYSVTAKLSGFKTETRPEIRLDLGSAPTVDFRLEVSGVSENVTVTSEVPLVEVANTAASTTISTEQVKALPLNGRNFTDLVLLTPETQRETERGTLSISGQRGLNTNVTVDGTDFNNPFFGGTVGAAEGRAPLSMSEESIKEISVITNGASVEFGRNGGGVVNVITKSGTNAFHGSAFYYWQPQDLISNFANGQAVADQSKKQYGASLGGPILKDRLFFFGSYERLKQDITIPVAATLTVPPAGQDQSVLDRISAKYPRLGSADNYAQQITNPIAFGRLDFQATETQRFTVRGNYTTYDGVDGTSNAQNRGAETNGIEGLFTRSWVAQYSGQFGANLLNDLNLNYLNEDTPRSSIPDVNDLSQITLNSPSATLGAVAFLPIGSKVERKQIADTVTFLFGKHVAKAGFDYNDTSIDQVFKGNWRGVYVFTNVDNLVAGKWSQYFQFGGLNGRTADQAGRAAFGQKELAFFVQDQWFVTPRLTITAGVRYERLNNPDDPILNPNHVINDGSCPRTTSGAVNGCFALDGQIPDSNNQWSPRIGVSFSPDDKTVVRVAAGRFWSRTPAILWAQLFTSNGVQGTQYTINAPSNGQDPTNPNCKNANGSSCYDAIAAQFVGWGANFNPVFNPSTGDGRINFSAVPGVAARPGVFAVDPNFQDPRTDRLTLDIDRQVGEKMAVGFNFTWANGNQLQRLTDINAQYDKNPDGSIKVSATNGQPLYSSTRPNPYYGRITTSISDAQSRYLAATFSAQRRFSDRFSLFASVTWSQDMDDDSNERNFAGIQPEDFNNLNGTYGYSVRDQKWRAGLNSVWATPWWGIGVSGSASFVTGRPINPLTGNDANNDGIFTDRPTVNGVHLARDSFRQPSFYTVSLRLSKTFTVGPLGLQVFGECYNCTNTGNKFATNNTYGTAQTPSATFAAATGVGTPRTFQLAARVDF